VAGEVSSYKIYEDDSVLAFLDINPTTKGHTIVIPKKHYLDLPAAEETDLAAVLAVIKKIAPAVVAGSQAEGFNLGVNNGAVAGQVIEHLHFHLIPRKKNDGLTNWPSKVYQPEEIAQYQEKIKQALVK